MFGKGLTWCKVHLDFVGLICLRQLFVFQILQSTCSLLVIEVLMRVGSKLLMEPSSLTSTCSTGRFTLWYLISLIMCCQDSLRKPQFRGDTPYIIHARSPFIDLEHTQNSGTVMQEELEKKASRVRGMLNKLLRIDDENIRTCFSLWGAEKSVI